MRSGKRMSALARQFEPVPQKLENVRFSRGKPLENAGVKSAIADAEQRLNGAGRVLVRASGTEPMIRIMAEGDDEKLVGQLVREIAGAVQRGGGLEKAASEFDIQQTGEALLRPYSRRCSVLLQAASDPARKPAMNPESIEGKVKNGVGQVEQAAGEVLGDPGMQLSGEARQIAGAAEDAVGRAREAIEKTAKAAREAITTATDQAAETYETLRKQATSVAKTVDPFVKEQPYIAVMLAAVTGLILGAMFAGGGARVIVIKPARE